MTPATSSAASPRSRAFVRWAVRHGRALWIGAALLTVPAGAVTTQLYLRLNTDIEQLLPRDSASVLAIEELRSRMHGLQYLGVVVDAKSEGNLPAAERFIDDLAARVRRYPPELVRAVKTGAEEERRFIQKHGALYADLRDLVTIRQRIAERKRWEVSHKLDLALDDDSAPPPLDLDDIAVKYEDRALEADRFPRGRFTTTSPPTTLLLIEVGGFSTGVDVARTLVGRVREDIRALGGPERYAPGMQAGFAGDVAVTMEEISALAIDLTTASLLVIAAVIVVILLYFQWWRCVPILFLPLGVSALYAFALATAPILPAGWRVTELNSNTAFLGSIIIGNGINFGIVLLARYVEGRRRGLDVEEALAEGIWGTRLGTLAAALAAGVAYASLVVTQFRGFRQFGVIGGLGMVLCWGTSFLLMPSLIRKLDSGPRTAPRPRATPARRTLTGALARWVAAHPKRIVMVAGALTVGSALLLPGLDASRIESDFAKLRRSDTWTSGEGYWGKKMDKVLGYYLSPTVVLADSPAEATRIAADLKRAAKTPPLAAFVSEVRSFDDILPKQQTEKLAEVEAIRRLLTPATRAEVSPERLAAVDRLLGNAANEVVTEKDLPASFTAGIREVDGTLTRAVLVFPKLTQGIWQGENLTTFMGELRRHAQGQQSAARVAGVLPLSADIVSSIRRDGPLASAVALAGVMALVILIFRRSRYTLFVGSSLVMGVLWLLAAIFLLRVKVNFINFIAFPITFGIGIDYAVNVMARYVQDGSRDIVGPVQSTGAAVGLCSLTTILGYSSLLLAKNHGLFLFGLVAVLGEITCLMTALTVLPAALLLWGRGRSSRIDPGQATRQPPSPRRRTREVEAALEPAPVFGEPAER